MTHDTALVGSVELHIFEHHRHVLSRNFLAHKPRHHFAQQCFTGRWRKRTTAVAIGADDIESACSDLGLLVLGQVTLDFVKEQAERTNRSPDPRCVAGHVDHRQHKRRDAHIGEHCLDRGVVIGDGKPHVRIAFVLI